MTIKEWAEEYRRINAWEEAERREWLRNVSVEESVRIYEELCRMVAHTVDDDPVLWDMRARQYQEWEDKLRRIARAQGYDLSI